MKENIKISILVKNIFADLKKRRDLVYLKTSLGFFLEPVNILGVRIPMVKKILRGYWPRIKPLEKQEIFILCESLFKLSFNETTALALNILQKKKGYQVADFDVYEIWFKKYISNWANCDDFCTHALGELVFKYPKLLLQTRGWINSPNRWQRRAATVVLIYSLRRGERLGEAFLTAQKLLRDQDEMVQKGYGWTLKEASNVYPKKVFDFVMKNKDSMTRLALRYAIEKLPKEMKKKAMVRS